MQVDLFVLKRAPEPFDKAVVAPAAFAIHADADRMVEEDPGKRRARELGALIGVEDPGHPYRDSHLYRGDAGGAVEADRRANWARGGSPSPALPRD